MSDTVASPAYALDNDEEPLRLERQARLYGIDEDLARLAPRDTDHVLDAGCGAGILTRAIAERASRGLAVGLDREPRYLAVRPGGRVVCCNFDGFCLSHHPTDAQVQADLERWFSAAQEQLGFDNSTGSKLPAMFRQAGLKDIRVEVTLDAAFSGFGGNPERQWNWEVQFRSVLPFSERVFGSRQAAVEFTDRVLRRFADPNVYFHCTLCYVSGTVGCAQPLP